MAFVGILLELPTVIFPREAMNVLAAWDLPYFIILLLSFSVHAVCVVVCDPIFPTFFSRDATTTVNCLFASDRV
jgi:hypothetical protein